MNSLNVVQSTVDAFAKALGGRRKAGSWYLPGTDAVVVLNLQKSNYGPRYYINFGLWFLGVGPANDPKVTHCHLQTRVERLVDDSCRPSFERLLDLEIEIPDAQRHEQLLHALEGQLRPFVQVGQTLAGLATPDGRALLERSLLDGDGQRFLVSSGFTL